MAKHNKTSRNNKSTSVTVTPVQTKINSQEAKVQENTMSNQATTISDLFTSNETATKELIKSGKAGMNKFKQLMKDIAKDKKEVKVNRNSLLKQAGDNKILCLQIRQHADMLMLEIDSRYEPKLKSMEIYNVENAEAAVTIVIEKGTKYVAPITRGAAEGIRSMGKTLFGFGLKK